MKHQFNFYLFLFVLFIVSCGSPQPDNTALRPVFEKDVATYIEYMNTADWDNVIEMMYPKLFDFAPKSQMKSSLAELGQMGMKLRSDNNTITKVSQVISDKNIDYVKIDYDADITIELSGVLLENVSVFKEQLAVSYGKENVTYQESNHTFSIDAEKSMIAVSTDEQATWKYFEFNESQKQILELMLPKEVYKEFKNL